MVLGVPREAAVSPCSERAGVSPRGGRGAGTRPLGGGGAAAGRSDRGRGAHRETSQGSAETQGRAPGLPPLRARPPRRALCDSRSLLPAAPRVRAGAGAESRCLGPGRAPRPEKIPRTAARSFSRDAAVRGPTARGVGPAPEAEAGGSRWRARSSRARPRSCGSRLRPPRPTERKVAGAVSGDRAAGVRPEGLGRRPLRVPSATLVVLCGGLEISQTATSGLRLPSPAAGLEA